MKLQDYAVILSMVLTTSAVAGGAGKYYMDTEYVQQKSLSSYFIRQDIKNLRREVRRIERIPFEERTSDQVWELQDLKNEITDLKSDINQTIPN